MPGFFIWTHLNWIGVTGSFNRYILLIKQSYFEVIIGNKTAMSFGELQVLIGKLAKNFYKRFISIKSFEGKEVEKITILGYLMR